VMRPVAAKYDVEQTYPWEVQKAIKEARLSGVWIPKEYGGLGFHQVEYGKIMELIGTQDANVLALLSAHQSIGVPQPLKLFGTPEQKKKYLPKIAKALGIQVWQLFADAEETGALRTSRTCRSRNVTVGRPDGPR